LDFALHHGGSSECGADVSSHEATLDAAAAHMLANALAAKLQKSPHSTLQKSPRAPQKSPNALQKSPLQKKTHFADEVAAAEIDSANISSDDILA
jgi:hypothetical protein